jgi:hypothetical protein
MRLAIAMLAACIGGSETDDDDGTDDADADTDTDVDDTDVGDTDDTDVGGDTDDTDDTEDTDSDCVPSVLPLPADDGDADLLIDGTDELSTTGEALAIADLDGDGQDDLVIGAPQTDSVNGLFAGRVSWVYGPLTAGGDVDVVADAWFDGENDSDYAGVQLGNLGDLDGDGLADVAAYAFGAPHGKVYVAFGSATRASGGASIASWDASFKGEEYEESTIGEGITGIGDVDGDGFDDLAFADAAGGTVDEAGRLYVFPGRSPRPDGDVNENVLPYIDGTEEDEICAGRCITSDDFDGDGLVDLVFSSSANYEALDRVWIRYGDGTFPEAESADYYPRLQKMTSYGTFGSQTASVGDLDGDGHPELAVTDEWGDTAMDAAGGVWIVAGGSRWSGTGMLETEAWLTIEGVESNGHVGSAVSALGDVDCDGHGDLAVGATWVEGTVQHGGAVGVWLNPTPGTVRLSDATATILGSVGDQNFGKALAHGDLDGDGAGDLVVGANGYGTARGRVYVFLDAF